MAKVPLMSNKKLAFLNQVCSSSVGGLKRRLTAVVVSAVSQRGRKTYTEVCGIFSPSRNEPPHKPRGADPLAKFQYRCPRCNVSYTRSNTVKQHFPRCIETNGNPDSLRWFDHASNNITRTGRKNDGETNVSSGERKQGGYFIDSLLADEPKAIIAASKVERWGTMAAEKQARTITSTLNNPIATALSATQDLTAIAVNTSNLGNTTVTKEPTMTLSETYSQKDSLTTSIARDEVVSPACKRPDPRLLKPKQRRQYKLRKLPNHNELTAHLFNNAGYLIPSIPGIDPVTERMFDQGKIMSLGPSRSYEYYYPEGGPLGDSFLLDHTRHKKRKREGEM